MTRTAQPGSAPRGGVAFLLAATFVVLLGLVPYHAGHSEFPGHEHPEGTPDHTHALGEVIGWLMAGPLLLRVVISLEAVGVARQAPVSWRESGGGRSAFMGRAPPASPRFALP